MQLRLIYPLILSAILFALLPSGKILAADPAPPPRQALSDLQQRLESLKQKLGTSQEAHKDAADALKDSERAISVANKKLFDLQQQQQKNKSLLEQLHTESTTAQTMLMQQQKHLSQQLYRQYLYGQQSDVQMILQSEHLHEVARDIHYFSYIAKARAELIQKMQGNLTRIKQLNEDTVHAMKEGAALKKKQLEERLILQKQKQAKSKIVKTLARQITSQRSEIKKLSRDEKRLAQLVEQLTRIAPAKQASNPAKKSTTKTIVNNDTLPSDEFSGIKFSSLKGKLRLPVQGEVSNRFGASREDSGISWKGLFIRATEGSIVKSVANGRVVFSDWLRGFGNLIIVDHGGGYMSLYGNNQAVLKQVGDAVNAGDTIASVGNSGGNESHGLYYELRRQSKPFDPLSWSNIN